MAVNDIIVRAPGAFGSIGTRRYYVNSGATAINAGEPVVLAAAFPYMYVKAMATNSPAIRTDYVVGIAQSASSQTSTAIGFVDVFPAVAGVQYFISPNSSSTYFGSGTTPSQTTYNGLIGRRVLIDLTTGSYTILSTDGANNGCVVEYTDVTKSGGKVAFSIRNMATLLGADSA